MSKFGSRRMPLSSGTFHARMLGLLGSRTRPNHAERDSVSDSLTRGGKVMGNYKAPDLAIEKATFLVDEGHSIIKPWVSSEKQW